jgi:hypothetical protein
MSRSDYALRSVVRRNTLETLGAGEGNRTLVISLEGYQNCHDFNAEMDKFSVRTRLDAVWKTDLVHLGNICAAVGIAAPKPTLPPTHYRGPLMRLANMRAQRRALALLDPLAAPSRRGAQHRPLCLMTWPCRPSARG